MVKRIFLNNDKLSQKFYIALLFAAGILILLIILGTIFGLARERNAEPLLRLGDTRNTQNTGNISDTDDIRIFSGLGQLRIPLVNSSILLLSIAFPFSAVDVTFTEELAAKIVDFRNIAAGYFSALPIESLIQIDEDAAKSEILKRFNNSLRLGRIEVLYFSDMTIIDAY
jgi:hypothetical protein